MPLTRHQALFRRRDVSCADNHGRKKRPRYATRQRRPASTTASAPTPIAPLCCPGPVTPAASNRLCLPAPVTRQPAPRRDIFLPRAHRQQAQELRHARGNIAHGFYRSCIPRTAPELPGSSNLPQRQSFQRPREGAAQSSYIVRKADGEAYPARSKTRPVVPTFNAIMPRCSPRRQGRRT